MSTYLNHAIRSKPHAQQAQQATDPQRTRDTQERQEAEKMSPELVLGILFAQVAILTLSTNTLAAALASVYLCFYISTPYVFSDIGYHVYSSGGTYLPFFDHGLSLTFQAAITVGFAGLSYKLGMVRLCAGYSVIFLFIVASFYSLTLRESAAFWVLGYYCEVVLIACAFNARSKTTKFNITHSHAIDGCVYDCPGNKVNA